MNERHVIKVPKEEPSMPTMDMPQEDPMGDPMQDNNGMPPMDNSSMMDDGQNNADGSMMDNDSMGMDDEQDPKKYIQHLTGKLSQELRNYNNEENDSELSKYVAGMIIPQAAKSMTSDDKKDIINKIKKGITDSEIEDYSDEESDSTQQEDDMMPQDEMAMESKKIVNEIINSMSEDDFERKRENKKITNNQVKGRNPFKSNR